MSSTLPKGEQTAFQRWEMTSFGDARSLRQDRLANLARSHQSELDIIKEKAKNDAYASAYKEAYEIGYQEGLATGLADMQAQTQDALAVLDQLAIDFTNQLNLAHREVGKDLVHMALELAQEISTIQFEHHPEVIINIVAEAISTLPAIHQPATIFLHPDDLQLIQELKPDTLALEHWHLKSDYQLQRGGCRIETAQNLVDASYEKRWERLSDALLDSTTSSAE